MHGCLQGKMQYDGILGSLKLMIVVSVDLQNQEIIGDNWSKTASTIFLNYSLDDAYKHKTRVTKKNRWKVD